MLCYEPIRTGQVKMLQPVLSTGASQITVAYHGFFVIGRIL